MTNEGKKKRTSFLSLLVRIGIAGLACWLVVKDLNYAELSQTFSNLHISLLILSCFVFTGGVCIIGFRWWIFMRAQKIEIPLFMAIKLTFLGQFFTNFMPSAVGGDLIRAWYVSQYTHRKLQAALGVLVDRVMGLTSTFILALTSYFLFMRGQGLLQFNRQRSGLLTEFWKKYHLSPFHILTFVMITAGIVLILKDFVDFKSVFRRICSHILHFTGQFKEVMMIYYRHPMILFFGLGSTIFLQSMVILSYWMIGRDLGMTDEIRYYFIFFPMIWVIGSIPISIAGIGILEGGLVLLFVKFTAAEPEAVITLALCQRLTWIFASIPGMGVHLTGSHRQQRL